MKLERQFGIKGLVFDWLKSYLNERRQFTVLNRTKSDLSVSIDNPQGSVLGPTLFTNDLPSSVQSGSLCKFADDTTVFCIGDTTDEAIVKLNRALQEVYDWCLNQLSPHQGKSKAMLLCRET